MSNPPSPRRRGGQPGNLNRLRHGLHSHRLTRSEPGFQLAWARKRLAQLLQKQESAAPHDYLSYEAGIVYYLSLIIALARQPLRDKEIELGLGHQPLPDGQVDAPPGREPVAGDGHPFVGILESIHRWNERFPDAATSTQMPVQTSDADDEVYP